MTKKKSDTLKTGTQKPEQATSTPPAKVVAKAPRPFPDEATDVAETVVSKPARPLKMSLSGKAPSDETAAEPLQAQQAKVAKAKPSPAPKKVAQPKPPATPVDTPPVAASETVVTPVAKAKVSVPTKVKAVLKAGPVAPKAKPSTQAETPVKPAKVAAPVKVAAQTPTTVAPAKTITPPKPAAPVPEPDLSVTGVPVRSGRPSSRLVQLTVPSMAQSVASNAVKASFTRATPALPILSPTSSALKKDSKLTNNWKKKPVEQLSDAEIMAMSDDDYMNETQLAFFRLKLVRLQNDILSNAGETTEHLREDTVVVPEPTDRATIEEEHALELRTRDRERKLLKKIEQSITSIDTGNYGYCEETGEAIGVGRLLARPTANLSLEAQQRREVKQKMFGE